MVGFRIKRIIPQNNLSDCLRRYREKKGLTANEIAKELMIPLQFIKVFENDNWRKLPQDIYTRKYLSAYLKFLGDEAADLYPLFLREWRGESGMAVKEDKRNPLLKNINKKNTIIVSHIVRKIGIFIIIFIFFSYLSWQFYNFFKPPRLEIFSPKDDLIVSSPLLIVEGRTEKETPLFINGVEVMLSGDGAFREELGLQKGVNIIKIEAAKKYGGKSVIFKKVLFE